MPVALRRLRTLAAGKPVTVTVSNKGTGGHVGVDTVQMVLAAAGLGALLPRVQAHEHLALSHRSAGLEGD